MGEYVDEEVDKGYGDLGADGLPPRGPRPRYRPVRTNLPPAITVQNHMVALADFKAWYSSMQPWGSCSSYEIASMAWNEAVDRISKAVAKPVPAIVDDDHFTWWWDELHMQDGETNEDFAWKAWQKACYLMYQ